MRDFIYIEGKSESGATMVEFAIVAILLIGFVGAIMDFGVLFHRHSLLSFSAAEAARKVQTHFEGNDCTSFQAAVPTAVNETFSRMGVAALVETQFQAGANGICTLEIRASTPIECFFCIFTSNTSQLRITYEGMIENMVFCNSNPAGCAIGDVQTSGAP